MPGPSKPLKFQPKSVQRRSLEDRQRLEREEADRQQARAQIARDEAKSESVQRRIQYGFQEQWRSQRHRGGSGVARGGRGGFMGDGPGQVRQGQLSGIGGAASDHGHGVRRGAGERWRGNGRSGEGRPWGPDSTSQGRDGQLGGASRSGTSHVDGDGGIRMPFQSHTYGSSSKDVVKTEVMEEDDLFVGFEDSEHIDLDSLNLHSDAYGGMLPVTVDRTAHVDRQFHINTDSSAAIGHQNAGSKSKNDSDVHDIKLESEDENAEDGFIPVPKPEPTSPPDSRQKARKSAHSAKSKRATSPPLNGEQLLQDENRRILLRELGPVNPETKEPDTVEPADAKETRSFNPRENSLYLIQLPSRVPPLARKDAPIKEEPTSDDYTGPTETVAEGGEVVKEEDTGGLPPPASDESHTDDLVPGYLGQMNVWKRGEVAFDWGGVPMLVAKGFDNSFVEMVVGMQLNSKDGGVAGEYEGTAYSFGQVRGKMVVTPDWKRILGLKEKAAGKRRRSKPMKKETEVESEAVRD